MSTPTPDTFAHIGKSVPRKEARRLLEGGGRYLDDILLPGLLHAAFVRSPHAHARIQSIDTLDARLMPGVVAVLTADDIDSVCKPWRGILDQPAGMQSPPQRPLARDTVTYQGEPVAIAIATTRAIAEDACDAVAIDYEPLPHVTALDDALASDAPRVHEGFASNIAFSNTLAIGDADTELANASNLVVEATLHFPGITGVTMEPRGIIAHFHATTRRLDVHSSTQSQYQVRDVLARAFNLRESDVSVAAPDVGGSFGLKLHTYSDEMATVAASVLLGRPVKFSADRMDAFTADIQARRQTVRASMALDRSGKIRAMAVDIIAAIGAYSVYPRTSFLEPNQVSKLCGGPYLIANYKAKTTSVFLNTAPCGQLRGVGHPIACAVTEHLMDKAAAALGIDAYTIRERNLVPADAFPHTSHGGFRFESLGQQQALTRIWQMTEAARQSVNESRRQSTSAKRLGFGMALFVELTSPGVGFYGLGGAHISSRETATARLEPSGDVVIQVGVTEQGQGMETALTQIAADAMGVPLDSVRIVHGSTLGAPHGSGTWASRGAALGGEATYRAARALQQRVVAVAAEILDLGPNAEPTLRVVNGVVQDADGQTLITVADIGARVHFRPDTLKRHGLESLSVSETYFHREFPYTFTNGAHAALVEVDRATGLTRLVDFWVVADCGTVINPLLADEQVRGAAVMGIGAALWEECAYEASGDLATATMADYLIPMAPELPNIRVEHMSTPTAQSELGAKGAGESGIAGAQGAILNAVNDALRDDGVMLDRFPLTPARIWHALNRRAP